MVKVFLDADVAFDIFGKRMPFSAISIQLVELSLQDKISISISEVSIANLFYLSFEPYQLNNASKELSDFIQYCEMLPSGKKVLLQALQSNFKDKEDAIQYFTTIDHKMDYFISRNTKDYEKFTTLLPVHSPSEFLKLITS